jgi:hypothetical protein
MHHGDMIAHRSGTLDWLTLGYCLDFRLAVEYGCRRTLQWTCNRSRGMLVSCHVVSLEAASATELLLAMSMSNGKMGVQALAAGRVRLVTLPRSEALLPAPCLAGRSVAVSASALMVF